MPLWYADLDDDMHGDPDSATWACEAPADHVADSTDCNDDEALEHPDLDEICGDGIDNNCNGLADGCGFTGSHDVADADVIIVGESDFGASLAVADIGQDGTDDLLVYSPRWDAYLGAVQRFDGGASFGPTSQANADHTIEGSVDGEQFGLSFGLADFNGDGEPDLYSAVAAEGDDAYLLYGPLDQLDSSEANVRIHAPTYSLVGTPGDVDGDGADDLALGDEGYGVISWHQGAVETTLSPLPATVEMGTDYHLQLLGSTTGTSLGRAIHRVGDLNGDTLEDFAVVQAGRGGRVYVYYGNPSGSWGADDIANIDIEGTNYDDPEMSEAHELAVGDLDGDGVTDLAIGDYEWDSTQTDAGAVGVFLGPVSGAHDFEQADVLIEGDEESAGLGSVLHIGELDGDASASDLVAAAVEADNGSAANSGAVYLFHGRSSWPSELLLLEADATYYAQVDDNRIGGSLAQGDLNSDGRQDLVIGAPNYSNSTVFVVFGSAP